MLEIINVRNVRNFPFALNLLSLEKQSLCSVKKHVLKNFANFPKHYQREKEKE